MPSLKYPIGKVVFKPEATQQEIESWKSTIASFPELLQALVSPLKSHELSYIYRPDGWNIRQVIHHLADSHMNCFIRFKLSLTEDNPTIKPYHENLWAQSQEGDQHPIQDSLSILQGVHNRWSTLLHNLSTADYQKGFTHPESKRTYTLLDALQLYAWHCDHHYAHIQQALQYKDEFS